MLTFASSAQLVLADGYPGSQGARNVSLEAGAVSFERFDRHTSRSLGRERLAVPHERLSLRLTDGKTKVPVRDAWISVRVGVGYDVAVRTTPGSDGLVRLPAINADYSTLHIKVPGEGTAVLFNLPKHRQPVEVVLARADDGLTATVIK